MKGKELLGWWVLEWDPMNGGYGIHPLRDVLERNMRHCLKGEVGAGRILLGLFPTLPAAQEAERQVKRRKRTE